MEDPSGFAWTPDERSTTRRPNDLTHLPRLLGAHIIGHVSEFCKGAFQTLLATKHRPYWVKR